MFAWGISICYIIHIATNHEHAVNNTTRKHPRSMQEAFGPYTSDELHEEHEPGLGMATRLTYAIAAVGFIILAVNGWLPGN